MSYDVLVLGAGPAGTAAALRAAELGAGVAVAEGRRVGGTCVNSGCVPTRVLAKAARLMRDIRGAGDYGIVVGEPRVVWSDTVAHVRAAIEQVQGSKRSAQTLAGAGAELFTEGSARFLDAHTVQLRDTGRILSAEAIILCIGGRSRRLPIPGAELAVTAEQVLDLAELPASIAIVGSGYTGVQLTTVFSAFGARVTLLEVQPRILPGADHDVAQALADSYARQGVAVETGVEGIERVEATPGGRRLVYRREGRQEAVDADVVLLSVGWPARVEGLDLDAAGVRTEHGYVTVDDHLRTSVPHIYAAGDVIGRAMLVQAADVEADAAAVNAVLGPTRTVRHALLPSGGFTDPDHAGVGLTEHEARERDRDCLVAYVPYAEMERAIIDSRTTGFLKLIADRRRSMLLGAHAAGENAVEVIQAVTTAMAAGVDVATLGRVEFAYPTYTAIVGAAAKRLLAAAPA